MSTKTPVWTEEKIREELARLDALVLKQKGIALEGRTIPIRFTYNRSTLGLFHYGRDGMYFAFSRVFFDDANMPEAAVVDVIRHEYAHYFVYVLYGKTGHSRWWKTACGIVGANPQRLYNPKLVHEQYERELKRANSNTCAYHPGETVWHNRYGAGVVQQTTAYTGMSVATVLFENHGVKRIDEKRLSPHTVSAK